MDDSKPGNPYRDLAYLMAHAFLTAVLPSLVTLFGAPWDYVIAFALGVIVVTIYDRRYAGWLFWSVAFIVYLLWEIILSGLHLAWIILQPNPKLDPGIVAVPLSVTGDLEILVLATAINLTPGSISLDLGYDESGRRVLYVQTFAVGDPEEFRRSIKDGFERLVMRISRGL